MHKLNVSSYAPRPSWLSDEGLKTLQRGYLLSGETPRDMYLRVAYNAAKYLKREDLQQDFFDILYKGYLGLATPVAANFGTANRGLPISCFTNHVSDSIPSIYSHLKESAMMSKIGGGVGIYLGDIRPSGSPISGGGVSTGIVPVAQQYDKCANYVNQNGIRRGSFAIYLPIEHPDAYELLLAKDHLEGDPRQMIDSNIAFTVTDAFMYRVMANDPEAVRVWAQALEMNMKVGSPYFVFIDNVNRLNPPAYVNHNLKVSSSNLCLTGDTLISTKKGQYPIKDLVGKTVKIFDGSNWVTNSNFSYQGKSKIVKVELNNGQVIKVTPDHRCLVQLTYYQINQKHSFELKASELKKGMWLSNSVDFSTEGFIEEKGAYLKGFLLGDGSKIQDRPILSLYDTKFLCEEALINSANELKVETVNTNVITNVSFSEALEYKNDKYLGRSIKKTMKGLSCRKQELYPWVSKYKKNLPNISEWTRKSRLKFISGLFDADGSGSRCLQLSSVNEEFCKDIANILFSLGYTPNLDTFYPEVSRQMFRVSLSSWDAYHLFREGYFQRLSWKGNPPNRKSSQWRKIVNISYEEEQDVYCTKVCSTSYFSLANGILTGNCSEITLFTDENHSFVCCLSSLNFSKWDEWKDWKAMNSKLGVVELTVYLLDAVMEEFIKRAKPLVGMGRAVRSAEKGRPIGIGAMGLHYLYQLKGLPFKSQGARELNIEIFKTVKERAVIASKQMAEEYGEPEWCEGTGMRHTHLCVEGSTKILTKKGNIPIKNLVDIEVEVWNGFEWSLVKPFKTRENTELLKVKLEGGYFLTCTPDHKWLIQNNRFKKSKEVLTKDLKLGDKLVKWDLPIINGDETFNYAYTAGFFTGDGSYNKSKPQYENCKSRKEIRLYGINSDKHQCISKLAIKDGCSIRTTTKGGLRFYIPDEVPDKFVVPSINTKLEDKLNWLAGYFDADGSSNGSLTSINKEGLEAVKEMAMSCGLFSRLQVNKGKNTFRLQFSPAELTILNAYTLRVKFKGDIQKRTRLKVLSITKVDNADSYCFTDKLNGTGLFNGIYTKQCAVAPTRTNSVISGAFSPGIEPIDSNSYTAKQAKGSFVRNNPLLIKLLEDKGINTPEVIDSILEHNGSVMHLKELTIDEKMVFLTAREIDPEELIRQGADRTPYICQGQSLNRFVHPDIPIRKLNDLVFKTWKSGNKSSYYTKSSSMMVVSKVKEAHIITKKDCPFCEKAKALFKEYDIPFFEYDRADVTHFPWKTVPQIWFEGHYIGGYEDLAEFFNIRYSQVKLVNGTSPNPKITLQTFSESTECESCQG